MSSTISVQLVEARQLAPKTPSGEGLQPYVVLRFGDQQQQRSKAARSTASGFRWTESFTFSCPEKDIPELVVAVHDKDYYTSVEPIGTAIVAVKDLKMSAVSNDVWLKLDGCEGEVHLVLGRVKDLSASNDKKGMHFTANRPWAGSIFAPSDFSGAKKTLPSASLELDHIYGYRARNCRSNVALLPGSNNVMYHAAAVGVVQVLDASHKQEFFFGHGGAEIQDIALNHAGDLAASGDRVTNNNEDKASVKIILWNVRTKEVVKTLDCGRKFHSVAGIAWSADDTYIYAVGTDNDHTILAFDWKQSEKPIASISGHSDKVLDIVTHPSNPLAFVAMGVKHIKFWDLDVSAKSLNARKGVFGKMGDIQTLLCGVFLDNGDFLTGCLDGSVYCWDLESRQVKAVAAKTAHAGGVFALETFGSNGFISGGKDGKVILHQEGKQRVVGELSSSVKALSRDGDRLVAGCDDSSVWYCESIEKGQFHVINQGHSAARDAEIWGLCAHPNGKECASVSEDGRVFCWDAEKKQSRVVADLAEPLGACCFSADGKWLAVTAMKSVLFILDASNLSTVKRIQVESKKNETLKPVKFSPDGKFLAVGGLGEIGIDVYDTSKWTTVGTCKGHSSHLSHLDWSTDSKFLRSNSLDHELLFWAMPSCEQQTFPSELKDVSWATTTCTTAWPTLGIWRQGMDGQDVNTVACNGAKTLLASGDDECRVNLFNYPATEDNTPCKSMQAHSGHVTAVDFCGEQLLFSTGGLDGCVMLWRIV